MPININITEKKYGFINPETGKPMSSEDFARKYPRVGFGRAALQAESKAREEEGDKSIKI